jgi:hypothetical protein
MARDQCSRRYGIDTSGPKPTSPAFGQATDPVDHSFPQARSRSGDGMLAPELIDAIDPADRLAPDGRAGDAVGAGRIRTGPVTSVGQGVTPTSVACH